MSLKKKIIEIATQTAQEAVQTIAPALINQIVAQSTGPYVAKITKVQGNTITVTDPNGSDKVITYIGDGAKGPGGTVLVNGNYGH